MKCLDILDLSLQNQTPVYQISTVTVRQTTTHTQFVLENNRVKTVSLRSLFINMLIIKLKCKNMYYFIKKIFSSLYLINLVCANITEIRPWRPLLRCFDSFIRIIVFNQILFPSINLQKIIEKEYWIIKIFKFPNSSLIFNWFQEHVYFFSYLIS